ncbi:hypothetical protein AVEN_56384-1 [Araneus ventricosus]|uniref:Uncharacterized protein n=1 Tax=Araneus ventricosus TaxID=182803 RepID=A0A4Y2ID20_ARAVE|nr:hypothetical protein AVEN_12426-1 [Araneus ventricosus]GBM75548.1 hypothetical protein AVEN_56384-1 [Araneus ventricosus]
MPCDHLTWGRDSLTFCFFTVSWHMRRPAPNFEQEWLKRVDNNLVSRHKIHRIVKFINENRDLFLSPKSSSSNEPNQQAPNDQTSSPLKRKKKNSI